MGDGVQHFLPPQNTILTLRHSVMGPRETISGVKNYVAQIDFGICTMKKAKNAPNRSFSSTVPRPMLATRPRPSPPSRRHPARPRRRAERPDTRCGPEAALTPPTHGATAPNLTDSAVSRRVTTRTARRPGARSRFLARKCAPR